MWPALTSGQQFLVMVTARGEFELNSRKMNGLMAELDTRVIPMMAWGKREREGYGK
jgi:hypothetical protein